MGSYFGSRFRNSTVDFISRKDAWTLQVNVCVLLTIYMLYFTFFKRTGIFIWSACIFIFTSDLFMFALEFFTCEACCFIFNMWLSHMVLLIDIATDMTAGFWDHMWDFRDNLMIWTFFSFFLTYDYIMMSHHHNGDVKSMWFVCFCSC